ncbi:MAG: Lrp/AsnC family transcriptional regulator [Phenylobacterium sp.]|uniref:Lrp/AsnC family transcriptional regulator n=1 Tax=Phenylobacterium sp. TaxID=1871053 RepID=UPI00391A5DDE
MDQFDWKIIAHLRQNGRASYVELSQAVHMSETTCQRRVRALEDAGVISGYAAQIDERALGLSLSVFVTVTLASQAEAALSAFEAAICEVKEVAECHLMTGGADYLLRLAVRDVDDLERVHSKVLTRIPGVERISSSLAMRTVVRRTALPV